MFGSSSSFIPPTIQSDGVPVVGGFTFHNPSTFISSPITTTTTTTTINTNKNTSSITSDTRARNKIIPPRGVKTLTKQSGGTWKDKLKARCWKQVKTKRNDILTQLREGKISKQNVSFGINELVSNELEYMGLELPLGAVYYGDSGPVPLGAPEKEELLFFLETALYEGLREEEERILQQYEEEQSLFELDTYVDHHVEEKEGVVGVRGVGGGISICSDVPLVICPICKENRVLQNASVFFCVCGMRVDTNTDTTSLPFLQQMLCNCIQEHSASGCKSCPNFEVQSKFGTKSMLVMLCKDCGTWNMVL